MTAEAFLESSNTEVATVDKAGLVTAVRRGEATMLARYEGAYAASTLVVMGDRSGFEWKTAPVYNCIDELVYEKLKQVKVLPSDLCTDARVHPPRLPRPDRPAADAGGGAGLPRRHATQPGQARRSWSTSSIGSAPFVEHWTNKWADLLQVNRKFLGEAGADGVPQLDPQGRRHQHAVRQVRLRAS